MDHQLLKFSSSANVLFGFVLCGLSFKAIMKMVVRHSKNLDSSYKFLFYKAGIIDVTDDLVFFDSCKMQSSLAIVAMSVLQKN